MVSCFCLYRTSMSSMVVLALFLLSSSYFWGLGVFSMILTPVALALSNFFTTSKQNSVVVEEVLSEEVVCSDEESSASTSIVQRKACQEQSLDNCLDYSTTSPDFLTESDSLSTSEDSEVEWPYAEEMDQSQDGSVSDGSISDEESLIEITLPTGNYIRQKEEEPKLQYFLPKKPEFSPDSIFRQNHLMDFLAEFNEMNEEENLIEIDISMGSIKYSRFEIEA